MIKFAIKSLPAIVFASVLSVGTPAFAASFNLNSITGKWNNPIGGGSSVNGVGTNEITWGIGSPQSGLKFNSSVPSPININSETNFILGELTHFNFPVNPPSVTSTNLDITLDLGTVQQNFKYTFNIDETTNNVGNLSRCSSFQQSSVPCDDKITFPSSFTPSNFSVDGKEYTLQIIGFSGTRDASSPISQFITEENKANKGFLIGRITTPPPSRTIPESASVTGLFVMGIFFLIRNRQNKVEKCNFYGR